MCAPIFLEAMYLHNAHNTTPTRYTTNNTKYTHNTPTSPGDGVPVCDAQHCGGEGAADGQEEDDAHPPRGRQYVVFFAFAFSRSSLVSGVLNARGKLLHPIHYPT